VTPRVSWRPFTTDRRVASTRLRTHRPIAYLKRAGWDVGLESPDRRPDVVVFQKAYAQNDLEHARRLQAQGVRIVADFCDNHLWVPEWTPALRARADRMRVLADLADVCVVASEELAAVLDRPSLHVHDALPLPTRTTAAACTTWHTRRRGRLRLLWFGTAGGGGLTGGLADLERTLPVLREVAELVQVSLTVVSNSRELYKEQVQRGAGDVHTQYLPWSTVAFHLAAARADVAVVPVVLDPFTRCKTSNRPATALMAGLACVADAVPSYAELGSAVRIGSWRENLLACASPVARDHDIRAGQDAVRRVYHPARVTAEWTQALSAAVGAGP
jgi:hypothetical protein